MTMAKPTDRCETSVSTVGLVDALVHFEAARIALRCHFEGILDPDREEKGLSEPVPHSVIPWMTNVGAA